MIDAGLLCDQHLLGEHNELHMLAGSISRGHSLDGFINKRLIEPQNIVPRHANLANEMSRRGMNHKSPLNSLDYEPRSGYVSTIESAADLKERCPKCLRNLTGT